jgi:hypothetical protein
LSSELVVSLIAGMTPLVSKTTTTTPSTKSYVIIIDNIEPEHVELMEFIRMLLTTHSIPVNSPNDPKVFESTSVHPFSLIATTRHYVELPVRFLALFAPVQLPVLADSAAKFIGGKLLTAYGMPPEAIGSLLDVGPFVLSQFPIRSLPLDILRFVSVFCFLSDKNDRSQFITALLCELFCLSLHGCSPVDYIERIDFTFSPVCSNDEERAILQSFLDGQSFFCAKFTSSKETRSFTAAVNITPAHVLTERLRVALATCNSRATEKIFLRFPPHVVGQWVALHHALSCPGRNAILIGRTGSGRYSLARLVAQMCECDFIHIGDASPEEIVSPGDFRLAISAVIQDVVTNAVIQQRKAVIFIRATKTNCLEVNLLASFAADGDFVPFFTKTGFEELSMKCSAAHGPGPDARLTAFRHIRSAIRHFVHVAIALETDAGYTIDRAAFDRIVFDSDRPEHLLAIAAQAMTSSETRRLVGPVASRILRILPEVFQLARQVMPRFHPNHFYDFSSAFAHFAASDYLELAHRKDTLQRCLDFVTRLESEANAIDKRLDSIAPTLQRLQSDSDALRTSYSLRKEAVDVRKMKLSEEHKAMARDVQVLELAVTNQKIEKAILERRTQQTLNAVNRLTDNDIETIWITVSDPLPAVRLFIELLCLLLDLPPSFERSAPKLSMDKDMVPHLIEAIESPQVNPDVFVSAQKFLDSPDMDTGQLESIAPALLTLYDWLQNVVKLYRLESDLVDRQNALEEKQSSFAIYTEEMNVELESVKQIEVALESERETMLASTAARVEVEKEYLAADKRRTTLETILKQIEQFGQTWDTEVHEFHDKCEILVGDAILFSFYLSFCGALDITNRSKVLSALKECMRRGGVNSSAEEPLEIVHARFVRARPEDHARKSAQISFDAHHVRATVRCPLLVDPDGLVTALVTGSVKSKKLSVISQCCSTLEVVIAAAVSEGKTLVVLDVVELNPLIASLLPLGFVSPESGAFLEVRVGSKMVGWDQKFKMILVSPVADLAVLPDSLLCRVTAICVSSSSLIATEEALGNIFLDVFHPDLLPELTNIQMEIVQGRIQRRRGESEMLNLLADIVHTEATNPDYDILADDQTVKQLVASRDQSTTSSVGGVDVVRLEQEVRQALRPFQSHVELCHTFWKVISRDLPRVNGSTHFLFSAYQKVISSVVSSENWRGGGLNPDQHSQLRQALLTAVYQFILPGLSTDTVFFFFFMAVYTIRERDLEATPQDLRMVLEHIRSEVRGQCDSKTVESATGNTFEHMKFTNVVNLGHFLMRFIVEQFGPDFVQAIPYFQVDHILPRGPSVPTIILAESRANPAFLVNRFLIGRCRHENLDCITLRSDLDLLKTARQSIQTAMNRGSWVLLHYSQPSRAAGALLADVFTQMASSAISMAFRLFVIASTLDFVPPSMIAKARKFHVASFPSIRNLMLQAYANYNAQLRPPESPPALQALAYATTLSLAIVSYRNFIEPIGFCSDVRPMDSALADILHALSNITRDTIRLDNLRRRLRDLVVTGLPIPLDRQRAVAQFSTVLCDNVLDDEFSLCPRSKDRGRWIIPDPSSGDFLAFLEQLPMFASTEVLRIATPILRNWNMSVWLARPFVAFAGSRPNPGREDVESQITRIRAVLPQKIGSSDGMRFPDTIKMFLLHEIEAFNHVLAYVKCALRRIGDHVNSAEAVEFARGEIPRVWRVATRLWTLRNIEALESHLARRHSQILRLLADPTDFSDVRLLDDPRFMLQCYRVQGALSMGEEVDYVFRIEDNITPPTENQVSLVGVTLLCGELEHEGGFGVVRVTDPKTVLLSRIGCLVGEIVPMSQGRRTEEPQAKIPLFRQMLTWAMEFDQSEARIVDGQSVNLVWMVELPVTMGSDELLLNGTCLYCQMTDQL